MSRVRGLVSVRGERVGRVGEPMESENARFVQTIEVGLRLTECEKIKNEIFY
jgi:hypothetical protein